jgi:protein-tyrosine phosphatase
MKILFVCLGNICRSPMAEGLFNHLVAEKGLSDKITSDSAGTGDYHIGELADHRMRKTSLKYGIDLTHCARQISISDFEHFDYILAMDKSNQKNILSLIPGKVEWQKKVYLLRDFSKTDKGLEVPDPYFGGMEGFEEVFSLLKSCLSHFLNYLIENHDLK